MEEQEERDIVMWNTNMLKSAISDILVSRIAHRMLNDDEAYIISKCPFFIVIKKALIFKLEVGDRQMTEKEIYKYANEIVDERIHRIRVCLSGAFYE